MRKPCCDRKDVKRGAWSNQEDEKLMNYIRTHGDGEASWTTSLPHSAGLRRCHKSCRLRWMNYLRPDLKLGSFTEDEEDLIIRLHSLLGNRWSLIAGRLPGRTENAVKNYWNSHLRRKLMNMGVIDSNNRHLIKNVSQPSNPGLFSGSTTSSKVHASRLGGENDHLSDATSCLDQNDNTSGFMLNLNLELAVTIPSNSNIIIDADRGEKI